jgi:hypothetical protein
MGLLIKCCEGIFLKYELRRLVNNGSGYNLIWGTIPAFAWRAWGRTTEVPSQNSRSACLDLNRRLPEYEAEMLPASENDSYYYLKCDIVYSRRLMPAFIWLTCFHPHDRRVINARLWYSRHISMRCVSAQTVTLFCRVCEDYRFPACVFVLLG